MADVIPPGSDQAVMTTPHAFFDAPRATPVVLHPHPFLTETQHLTVAEGATVAEIVAAAGLPERYHGFLRVWVGDVEIPREAWRYTRPKAGRSVYVKATPQGGGGNSRGGKNILASILMLVVTVAAAVFAPMIAGAVFPGLSGAGLKIATGLIGAGISLVGSLLVSALIPPPQVNSDQGVTSQRALLSGVRNQFQPYADIPRIFGRRRVYPLQAARPYTEAQGASRYLRVLLCAGWGPLQVSDIKIGETPITAYAGVEVEIREGWTNTDFGAFPSGKSADTPSTLFTSSVSEDQFNVLLEAGLPGAWVTRVTEPNTSEISVDVAFPQGLARYTDTGGRDETTVSIDVEWRLVGSPTWTSVVWDGRDAEDGTATNGRIDATDRSATPVWRGGRWKVPAPGQYEVRLRRNTQDRGSRWVDRAEWVALRSIRYQNPININGLCLIAIRMKASDQLNGLPDTINCVVQSYLPVWNGSTWTYALSRNPAWAYADLMRRRGTERLINDSRIDLTAIQAWATACDATAPNAAEPRWQFDGIVERGAVFTGLRQIAAHGRASFCLRDGRYSVVRDIQQTVPVQHITPRNSFNYSGSKAFVDLPHALKVQFINASNGYQEDEVIVYADGFNSANATRFETLDLPACTSPTQAWREGRYYLAVGRLRPEEHTVQMDIENLRCTLGSYVLLAHDVLSIGIGSGRIEGLNTSGSNIVSIVLDGEVPVNVGRSYVLRVRRSDGTSTVHPIATITVDQNTSVLTLATPVPVATGPRVGDLFMFGEANLEAAPMIVKRIEPGPEMTAKLTLVDAQPGVWTADTGTIPAFQTYVTNDTPVDQRPPPVPTFTLRSDEAVVERLGDGTLQDRIGVTIATQRGGTVVAAGFDVQFREAGSGSGAWRQAATTSVNVREAFISPVVQGQAYDVRVRAVTRTGVASDWAVTLGHVVVGKTTPPSAVTGFAAQSSADGVQLSWAANPEIDVVGYQIRRGTSWDAAQVVTTLVTGTSFFVAVTTPGTQNFLIRAVDAIGLLSPSPTSVSAQVSAPGDVSFFEVYPQEDYIRATWTPVDGAGIEYEIRNGDSWVTARTVTRAAGDSVTVKWPIRDTGSPIFWIKAVSGAGVYSTNASFTTAVQQPLVNRNVILDLDFSSDTWAGQRVNLAPSGTGLGSTLQVSDAPDGAIFHTADYYRTIALAQTFYARNWIELFPLLTTGSGVTWATAGFTWAGAGDATWVGTVADTAGTRLRPFISVQDGSAAPTDLVEAFPLNGSLTGSAGTTPAASAGVAYGTLHFGQGLNSAGGARARYLRSVAATFTFLMDLRVATDANGTLARLLTASGSYDLRRIAATDTFRLSVTGQPDLDLVVPLEAGDLVTIGLAQGASSRTLMVYSFRTGEFYSATQAQANIGAITEWRTYNTDADPQPAPGRVGAVQLRNTAMTLAVFFEYAPFHAPLGYSPFKELIPGDFSYQNAIVWLNFVNLDRTVDVTLSSAKMRVDVPDVVERGNVSVTTGGTTVTFSRPFKAVPDVTVSQRSGTLLGIPRIVGSVTTTGFTVQLFDAANPGTAIAGTVSYTAIGY